MSARRQIIAALSEDSMGGIATLHDVAHAEQLVDAYRVEVLAEKASAPAPTATPAGAVFDPLPSYLHSIGHAGSETERGLYAGYVQAIAEVVRLQAETGNGGQPAASEATPGLNDRQTRLLDAIRGERGHWKTGRVLRFYEQNEFNSAVRTARFDLTVLRDAGHITQHDTKGVRFYTYRTKDSRS
jgi:hypothetical protein